VDDVQIPELIDESELAGHLNESLIGPQSDETSPEDRGAGEKKENDGANNESPSTSKHDEVEPEADPPQ